MIWGGIHTLGNLHSMCFAPWGYIPKTSRNIYMFVYNCIYIYIVYVCANYTKKKHVSAVSLRLASVFGYLAFQQPPACTVLYGF